MKEMLIYRDHEYKELIRDTLKAMEMSEKKDAGCSSGQEKDDLESLVTGIAGRLIEFASEYGFYGNLWQMLITYVLVSDENEYSKACEIRGNVEGSLNEAAIHDLSVFKEWFDHDLSFLDEREGGSLKSLISDYKGSAVNGKHFMKGMNDILLRLSKTLSEKKDVYGFKDELTGFYKHYGAGKFGLNAAFRVSVKKKGGANLIPVSNVRDIKLDDLVGYELAKQKLIENTEAFVEGRNANNCLLFGPAGTGKSSSIKAVLNMYRDRGLRMIELNKDQFRVLYDVMDQIKDRNYRFIIYMDDLSFEDFETDYKYLKAMIEGGLEERPDNVLIYATSNRRHLIKESFSDRNDRDDELHISDTMQEKLSLSARFGVTIYFGSPDKKEFNRIVKELADRYGINMPEDELISEANKWELSHGGLSGRTAQNFIDHLAGRG